ncbi:hypothetical protein [Caballeronia sp. SL2Y3]|uniref:hypothetical protein n=1 Tax=Caballeronia sp. SL2Y3 TaxID=2878151 RepID=UPI001FD51349|nr:hypothetical protein [Caballeronia sp. SL2Y3]
MSDAFSLERFDRCVQGAQYDDAIDMLFELNKLLDRFPYIGLGQFVSGADAHRCNESFARRLSDAAVSMIASPDFTLTDGRLGRLERLRPLIWSVMAATPPRNADHFVAPLLAALDDSSSPAPLRSDAARRLSLLYSPESSADLDITQLWNADRASALSLAIAIAAERFAASTLAQGKRNRLLQWLAGVIELLDQTPPQDLTSLWSLYMHCSYAEGNRHAVKSGINALVRKGLANLGLADVDVTGTTRAFPKDARPLMLVVAESFNTGHSIVRTHSAALAAVKSRFELVAFCPPRSIDDSQRAIFDRTVDLPDGAHVPQWLRQIRDFAETERPAVLYMPSVGMSVLTVFLSNMRLAPLQIAGLGHPATTRSDRIDYISVEDDYVGDPACFTEKLLRLPKDGQPYRPSALLTELPSRSPNDNGRTDIAIAASCMKLNPAFLAACKRIVQRARTPIHLHFIMSGSNVFTLLSLQCELRQILPAGSYTIHGFTPYATYVKKLASMDMFLSPFPFGNTNGIVDAFTAGLPGVCKTGPEVFEHIDGALLARASMPSWLVTETVEDYVEAAVRLATNREEREAISTSMLESNAVQRFFEGRPEAFGDLVLGLVRGTSALKTV